MAVTILLAAAVAVYAGFVIRKKVKDIKKREVLQLQRKLQGMRQGLRGTEKERRINKIGIAHV